MINRLLDLTNKADEFEKYLSSFDSFQKKLSKKANCLSCIKNFSNTEIILKKKILITKIQATEKSNIFFQCLLDLNMSNSEEIEFSFIVNDICIYKSKKNLNSGSNQVCVMQNYMPIASENLDIYIEINPLNNKQVNLSMASLFMWGKFNYEPEISYQVIETNDKYLISLMDNNSIYYKLVDKMKLKLNFSDFTFLDNAISYSFCHDTENNKTYYFRVDLMGNLFYSDFYNQNEIYIESNVSKVSCAVSNNGNILVCYIKNNTCFCFEIYDKQISYHKRLFSNISATDCLCYYNKFRDKFCIIATSSNDSNYFVEEIDDNFSQIDNINASYSVSIELYSAN